MRAMNGRPLSRPDNLKKCCFHQDEVCFLGYEVSSKGINIEAEQIEVVRKWLEPKLV